MTFSLFPKKQAKTFSTVSTSLKPCNPPARRGAIPTQFVPYAENGGKFGRNSAHRTRFPKSRLRAFHLYGIRLLDENLHGLRRNGNVRLRNLFGTSLLQFWWKKRNPPASNKVTKGGNATFAAMFVKTTCRCPTNISTATTDFARYATKRTPCLICLVLTKVT